MKSIRFEDYPEFSPNMTPEDIFQSGSFGGTYFRPIYSKVTKEHYKNVHHKYGLHKISPEKITRKWLDYDISVNKYNVKVGTTLEYWESKNWINEKDPYGWVQWYCEFYSGRRSSDDDRQIKRWLGIAGPNGRFRKRLLNLINEKGGTYNDFSISPKIRQTLQHWAFTLTKSHVV